MTPGPTFWEQAMQVWERGGSLMPVLAALSLYSYYVGFDLWFRLRKMMPRRVSLFTCGATEGLSLPADRAADS